MRVSLIYPNLRGERAPNLGFAYVATALEARHDVQIIDLTWNRKGWRQHLQKQLEAHQPDVLGFTSTHWEFSDAIRVARQARQVYRRVPIIHGGIHPSLAPREVLQHPEADAVCLGEGETTFNQYLDRLERGEELDGLPGLWFKRDGSIVANPLRHFDESIDAIPFPNWDLWDIEAYLNYPIHPHVLMLLASRGCPYRCSFCTMPVFLDNFPGRYFRWRSPENIVAEMKRNFERYWDAGFRIVSFCDNTFGMHKRDFLRLCDLIMREGLNQHLVWICNTRADTIDEEWVERAKASGCMLVKMGVEAGDDYIRNQIHNKELDIGQVRSMNEVLQRHDVLRQYNFIFGAPGETIETMQKSVGLIRELEPDFLFYSVYQPLERTEMLKTIEKVNGTVNQDVWKDNPNFWFKPLLDTPRLKARQVKWFMIKLIAPFFFMLLHEGVKMRGLKFLYDLGKVFLYLKWKYKFPFIYGYVYTILQYRAENWARRNNAKHLFRGNLHLRRRKSGPASKVADQSIGASVNVGGRS